MAERLAVARLDRRQQLARLLGVAGGEVVLRVAGAQEGRAEDGGERRGEVRGSEPEHARDLEDALLGQPGLPGQAHVRGLAHVAGVEHARTRLGSRDPDGPVQPLEELDLEARALGHLLEGEALVALGQRELDGQQHELVERHGAAQLVVRHARGAQVAEEGEPSLALALAGHVVEQPERLEVLCHAHIVTGGPATVRTRA